MTVDKSNMDFRMMFFITIIACLFCANAISEESVNSVGFGQEEIVTFLDQIKEDNNQNIWQIITIDVEGERRIRIVSFPKVVEPDLCEITIVDYRYLRSTQKWDNLGRDFRMIDNPTGNPCWLVQHDIYKYIRIIGGNLSGKVFRDVMLLAKSEVPRLEKLFPNGAHIEDALLTIILTDGKLGMNMISHGCDLILNYHENQDEVTLLPYSKDDIRCMNNDYIKSE